MRDFCIRYGVSIVLVVVALFQIHASHTAHISPWKGGGFGMFSTVSSPRSYFIRVYGTVNGKTNRVKVPKTYGNDEKNLRYSPSKDKFEILKKNLAKVKWILADSLYQDANEMPMQNLPLFSSTHIVQDSNLTVELWQYSFFKEKSLLYSSKLISY